MERKRIERRMDKGFWAIVGVSCCIILAWIYTILSAPADWYPNSPPEAQAKPLDIASPAHAGIDPTAYHE